MDVKSDSVIIQWTVPYISYSPETYVVQYGTSRDSLIHNSSSTHSEEEVMTYSVELSGLRDNTTYYVQVLATNTAQRSNRSTVHTFTTLPLQSGDLRSLRLNLSCSVVLLDLSCIAAGEIEVTVNCSTVVPGTFLECSFDNGPLHSCKDHVENTHRTSFVLNCTRFCSHGAEY